MAIYYSVGTALVSRDELVQRREDFATFAADLRKASTARMELSTGILTAETLTPSTPFTPIGRGKPLAVEIRQVYTGYYPPTSFFSKSKDMLVTSAIKSITTFNAMPRAVNYFIGKVPPYSGFTTPPAPSNGTPVLYYSPAEIQTSLSLTLDVIFDDFPDAAFNAVASACTAAAGIPVFAPASLYLLAAGIVVKLLGGIGEKLFDGTPAFTATEPIDLDRPGVPPAVADFRLVLPSEADPSFRQKYQIGPGGQLVDASGTPYHDDQPYIVISLDGADRGRDYGGFTATAATAAVLERFFHIKEGQDQPLGELLDALKLYNDWTFRRKAESLSAELQTLTAGSAEYLKVQAEYDAAVRNITNDLLKPPPKSPAK